MITKPPRRKALTTDATPSTRKLRIARLRWWMKRLLPEPGKSTSLDRFDLLGWDEV